MIKYEKYIKTNFVVHFLPMPHAIMTFKSDEIPGKIMTIKSLEILPRVIFIKHINYFPSFLTDANKKIIALLSPDDISDFCKLN